MHDPTPTTPGPHRDFTAPDIELPVGACDSHVHIFGPHRQFPYAAGRPFTPEDVSLEVLQDMHDTMGFTRAVLVQTAAHGHDHAAVVDAMTRYPGRYRGVALLAADADARQVENLAAAGFCGVRVHFAPHLGTPPSADALARLCDLIGPHGWHLEVHTMGTGILDFADQYPRLPLRIVLDHMGRFPMPVDRSPTEHRTILDLLDEDDVWIKLSGADRVSKNLPSMSDGLALARSFFEHRPDRCVWGSDFPHPNTHGFMPADRDLVNGLAIIAPTESERQLLLVDNPTACFNFSVDSATPGTDQTSRRN